MKQCPKCGTLIKHATHFYRHLKSCGATANRVQCPHCPATVSRKDNLKKHIKAKHSKSISPPQFRCWICEKKFRFEMAFKQHQKCCGVDKPKPFKCDTCGKCFTRKATLIDHQQHVHQEGGAVKRKAEEFSSPMKKPKLPEKVNGIAPADKEVSSLKGAKVDAIFFPKTEPQRKDQQVFFKETLPRLQVYMENALLKKKAIKWNLVYHCTLEMPDKYREEPMRSSGYFRSGYPLITTYPQQLSMQFPMAMESVEECLSTFMQAGSGWTLQENHALILEMVDYQPLGGSSYIKLPKDVYDTKSIINVQNQDQECFKWSILAALHPASRDAERVSKYQAFKEELNFTGIEFPVTVDQIGKFEKLNPGISVTVIGIDEPERGKKSILFPLRVPEQQQENHVVLIYWSEGEISHYAWVKNMDRLLSCIKKGHNRTYFCERCFQGFIRQDLLLKHGENCKDIPIQAVEVVNEKIHFKNWAKTEECLFRVYGDFECLLQDCEGGSDKTIKVQKHIPCSVAWVLISDHPEVENRSFLYRPSPEEDATLEDISADVINHLMESLQDLEQELCEFQKENKDMILSEEQEQEFQAATQCYMCQKPFMEEEEKYMKVRDHNHATGQYRGAAHSHCNINKKRSYHIPVFFHNLRGYDSHLIMQGIHRYAEEKRISIIPNTMEKYVSFQLGNLRFLDSLQFLGPGSSLDTLAKNLTEFPHLKEQFENVWSFGKPEDLNLLQQKGIYPYSYVKNFKVFEETSLPPKEAFKNDLTGDSITNENYQFAQQVWSTMNCENLGEYHDIYLYQDIFLLADIFEQFRQTCLQNYDLDPAHYYTVPGLA